MINKETIFNVIDNSGVKRFKSIHFYKKTLQSNIKIKDIFLGVLKKVKIKKRAKLKNLKKGDKKQGIILQTKKSIRRFDGSYLKFNRNSAILIDNKMKPLANRITSAIPFEIRNKKTFKIALLARYVL